MDQLGEACRIFLFCGKGTEVHPVFLWLGPAWCFFNQLRAYFSFVAALVSTSFHVVSRRAATAPRARIRGSVGVCACVPTDVGR